jgi:hypothetical protein
MPLMKGSSKKTIGANIAEMVRKFKNIGKIGTSRPENKGMAVKQAVAIAFRKAGKSKRGSKR